MADDLQKSRLGIYQIDLSGLPAPEVIEPLDAPTLFTEWVDEFQGLDPAYTVLLESDPAIKVLEVGGYREMVLRQRINDALKAVLLPTSYGTNLDALGARFGVLRMVVIPANPNTYPPIAQVMESDDLFKIRIGYAPDAFASAGPYGAYQYQARTSDANIVDVQVYNQSSGLVSPGTVLVVLLTSDDSFLSDAIRNCFIRLHQDDIQPMTDNVVVRGAQRVSFDISAVLHVGYGPDKSTIQAQALARLKAYLANRRKIGKRIPITGISAALQSSSIDYVELYGPTQDVVPGVLEFGEVNTISLSVVVGG